VESLRVCAAVNFARKFTLALPRRFALIEAIDAIHYCSCLARERYIHALFPQINCASRDKNKNTRKMVTARKCLLMKKRRGKEVRIEIIPKIVRHLTSAQIPRVRIDVGWPLRLRSST
jgi:hypothetical protein